MESKSKYNKRLEALAELLVTPERFGKIAVAKVIEYPYGLRLLTPKEHGWASGIPEPPEDAA